MRALLSSREGHRQHRLGPIQRLHLRLLIHRQDDSAPGWVQVEADDIGDLLRESRVLRNLEGAIAVRLEAVNVIV
jgi:hypothetical protein